MCPGGRQPGQHPVVAAAAPPQPHPCPVHREAGQQHRVGVQDGGGAQARAVRLKEPPPRREQMVRAPVGRPVQVVVGQEDRQQHPHATPAQRFQEGTGARFAPHGDVRGDRTGVGQFGQAQGLLGQNRGRPGGVLLRQEGPRGEQFAPQGALRGRLSGLVGVQW